MLTKLYIDFLNILKYCFDSQGDIEREFSDQDFYGILKLADEHSLGVLVYNKIYAIPQLPEDLKKKWTEISFHGVSSQVLRQERFLELYNQLLNNGIKAMVLKGVTLRDIYPEGDCRPSCDEDIFVKKDDVEKVRSIFESNGLIYDHGGVDEWVYKDHETQLIIEIHTKLIESFIPLKYDFVSCMNPKRINVGGVEIYTLNYTENCLYLFFHIYQHFVISGVGIRQLCDLFQYINLFYEKIDWNIIKNALIENDLIRFFDAVINIGRQYLFLRRDILNVEYINVENLVCDILSAGVYGGSEKERAFISSYMLSAISDKSESRLKNKIKMVFPGYKVLKKRYSYIEGKPFLLPVAWINRFCRIIRSGQLKDSGKGVAMAQSRVELFSEYGLLKRDK